MTCGVAEVRRRGLRGDGGLTAKKKLVSRTSDLFASREKVKRARRTWLPRCTGKRKNEHACEEINIHGV
jgi:hypothetical protein